MTNNESRKENDQERISIQKLLTAKDVAEILGISVKTVNKLVREGKLGCVQVTSKERRFTEEQVRGYIEGQSRGIYQVRVDTPRVRQVSSQPPKGGEKSLEFSRRSLVEEMRQWQ
jgi:excisionase family DNA binding protein